MGPRILTPRSESCYNVILLDDDGDDNGGDDGGGSGGGNSGGHGDKGNDDGDSVLVMMMVW